MKSTINSTAMEPSKKREDLSVKIKIALDKATQKIMAEAKANNSYIVVSDKKGGVKKIYAKDL